MSQVLRVFEFAPEPDVDVALREAAARVLGTRWYVLGEEVSAFEREFAAFCGTDECVGVANGTDALELALRAMGVERADRVAIVANAGYYACTAVMAIGADPVFVDVDETLTMSPAALRDSMHGLKAVVVTHLYGRLAAIEAILAIAAEAGVGVIEDCAQAHGAKRGGRLAGSFGVAGCFSFYPTKNLGALGDGGAVVTSDPVVASRLRALRQYGWSTKYTVQHTGGRNSRLDELQAAFLRVKLPYLASRNAARMTIARQYCEGLRDVDVRLPELDGEGYVAHLFVIRTLQRASLRARLAEEQIETEVHYPIPDYRQPILGRAPHRTLPMTEAACREVLTLPCHPGLSSEHVNRVIDAVRRQCRSGRV